MENPDTSKTFKSSSTQTEYITNKGKGIDPIDPTKHSELFTAYNDLPNPLYRLNLTKVFNEELLSEASQKELKIIMDYVKTENWEDLKKLNPLYYRIRRDLSVTPTNCLLYDNRLVILSRLKQLVLDTIHHNHPGQAGMLPLAKLIWWPHIHSEIVSKAKACRQCIDKGKSLKALIPKTKLGQLPSLIEPNKEIQMDFAGPIPYKNTTQNNYILVTVDRLSRYPNAELFHNCDTENAIDYLERYCKIHGIPRSNRCDQAQAFKAKEFEIFCKNRNIKLILAPAGDHRGTGMVERLIQTLKRRLAVIDIDPMWSSETLSARIASIIENVRLIPNKTTKVTPFESHFGRKPNTELSNMLTKPSIKNLSYKKLIDKCLDMKLLRHDALTQEEMWKRDGSSENELDIQYNTQSASPTYLESDDSKNQPLIYKSPSKISPSEIHFSIGDKTTKIIYNKRNVARKSIARKTKEPRNTLAPQWNIIQDGTIKNCTPHTLTIDTPLRKNTVIRKNDIAIATETKPLPETKPRLIHMVECKTIGEYRRNQEKIKKFFLEEAKQNATNNTSGPMRSLPTTNDSRDTPGPSRIQNKPVTSAPKRTRSDLESSNKPKKRTCKKEPIKTKWSKEKVIKLATKNQREEQQPKGNNKPKNKQSTPVQSFNEKAKQAALKHSMTASTRRLSSTTSDTDTNRSFLIFNTPTPQPSSIQIFNVDTDIPGTAPFEITTSNDPTDFMETSKLIPKIQSPQLTASTSLDTNSRRDDNQDIDFNKSTKKLDKIVKKINTINAEKEEKEQAEPTNSPEPIVIYLDTSNSPNGADHIQSPQSEQAPNGEITSAQPKQPDMLNKNEPTRPPQAETQKSPASSLIYKTPPSSPQPDTISDLDEDDIKALNEIQ